jgi:hypothetical protein
VLFSSDVALWLAGLPGMADYFPVAPSVSADGRWIAGGTVPITFDGYGMPDTSGPYIAVGVTGGAPTQAERTLDVPLLSVVTVGPQDDHTGGEKLTSTVDDTLMGLPFPQTIPSATGGNPTHLVSLDYSGGQPRFLDRDPARRSVFTASYVLVVARTVL